MQNIDLGDDDGRVSVTIGGDSVTLDLWHCNNVITDYHKRSQHLSDDDYNAGLVEVVKELGLPAVSHKMAARFVQGVRDAVNDVKKKARDDARIARFYGLNPRVMGRNERQGYLLNIDAVWAEEVLRDRGGALSAQSLYVLTYLSTGDLIKAQLARAKRALEEGKQGRK